MVNHVIKGLPSDLVKQDLDGSSSIKVTSSSSASQPSPSISAMGETSNAPNHPVIQMKATHGITSKVFPVSLLGGSASAADSMFSANSGSDANGVAAILSDKEVTCRAGQGIRDVFSAVFDTPQTDNLQIAGFITSESALCFGYDEDEDFGVLFARDGALETQDLQITAGASVGENALITIDSVAHTVPLTGGSNANLNAYEIAEYLQANDPRYNFTSNIDTVTCLAKLPELGAGIFTFSSGTATGTFTEIQVSSLGTNTWTKKVDWNVNPDFEITPQFGNSYMIQYSYNGFDGVNFFIKNPTTDEFELVHIIQYGNTETRPSVQTPIFRIGIGSRNVGNTTPVTVKSSGAAAFNEGDVVYDYDTQGIPGSVEIASNNDEYNVLTFRSRRVFNDTVNRSETHVKSAFITTETTQGTTFKVIKNASVDAGEYFDFSYKNDSDSLIEVATNEPAGITGEVLGTITIEDGTATDITGLFETMHPGDMITISASKSAGASATAYFSINLQDDL